MECSIVRRRTMQAVKSKDTTPELIVRRLLHARGYRYRLHGTLPGHPDLVFPSKRKIIFIHGCFWHGHNCARGARVPKTNTEYWTSKIARNRVRDLRARQELQVRGWRILYIWECELKDQKLALKRICRFLNSN
jgi:DNA mismatch endonuclease (patch repair protein)